MYTGEHIKLGELKSGKYDVDHIHPRNMKTDNSIRNNKVLCSKSANEKEKGPDYPLPESFRKQMPFWKMLKECGAMSDEKFARLARTTELTRDEKIEFINRQLVETRQIVKAVITILKLIYPRVDVIGVRAQNVSEFRREFEIYKSRQFNELHHAEDAYILTVVGNVMNEYFRRRALLEGGKYSVKIKTIFGESPRTEDGKTIWNGEETLDIIRDVIRKDNACITTYPYLKTGKLFDTTAEKKSPDLTRLKKELPSEKYGGYNSSTAVGFMLVKYRRTAKDKYDIAFIPIEQMFYKKFISDRTFADEYLKRQIGVIESGDIDDISLPVGNRLIKIDTILLLDRCLPVAIKGKGSRGKVVRISCMAPFRASAEWTDYVSILESFVKKHSGNSKLKYDAKNDKVDAEKNLKLYDLCIDKLKNSIYRKRPNAPVEQMIAGREKFMSLDMVKQCRTLLNVIRFFGRDAGGEDLSELFTNEEDKKKQGANIGATDLSAKLSVWKKDYSDVRIVDISAAGMTGRMSENLLSMF